jgi:hypothetical protein
VCIEKLSRSCQRRGAWAGAWAGAGAWAVAWAGAWGLEGCRGWQHGICDDRGDYAISDSSISLFDLRMMRSLPPLKVVFLPPPPPHFFCICCQRLQAHRQCLSPQRLQFAAHPVFAHPTLAVVSHYGVGSCQVFPASPLLRAGLTTALQHGHQ